MAQWGLGVMYSEGLGVPQDYAEGVKWYRRAANQGLPGGQS
jgi:TPR repeat protein